MKAEIHPDYKEVTVTCACGNVITTKSTKLQDFGIDICSNCHPFYSVKERTTEAKGQVERFRRKYGNKSASSL